MRTFCLALLAVMTGMAVALPHAAADESDDWASNLTGNWDGWRRDLLAHGIDLSASYLGETAGNPVGGQGQGVRYAHEIDFGAILTLQDILVPRRPKEPPGNEDLTKLYVQFAEFAGRSLTADKIGNIFQVQEVFDGDPDVRLSRLFLEQDFASIGINVRAGWLAAGEDFSLLGTADDNLALYFQSGAFAPAPGVLFLNSGFTVTPFPSWGGRVRVTRGDLSFQAGAYEVDPDLYDQGSGFKLGLASATGAYVPVEVSWRPKLGQDGLQGYYTLGAYYDSSDTPNAISSIDTESPPNPSRGRWGLYVLGRQNVTKDLTVFGGFFLGDPQTAEMRYFVEAGLSYVNPFGRPLICTTGSDASPCGDAFNFGYAQGWINRRIAHAQHNAGEVEQTSETILEANYGLAVTKWLTLRPGLQLVLDPGADPHTPDALVLDLQTSVTF